MNGQCAVKSVEEESNSAAEENKWRNMEESHVKAKLKKTWTATHIPVQVSCCCHEFAYTINM